MKGGKSWYYSNPYYSLMTTSSRNAKADPLEQPKRTSSPSVYTAAIEEFKNGGYHDSDEDEDEDEGPGKDEGDGESEGEGEGAGAGA
jgi:hypothetical protein